MELAERMALQYIEKWNYGQAIYEAMVLRKMNTKMQEQIREAHNKKLVLALEDDCYELLREDVEKCQKIARHKYRFITHLTEKQKVECGMAFGVPQYNQVMLEQLEAYYEDEI